LDNLAKTGNKDSFDDLQNIKNLEIILSINKNKVVKFKTNIDDKDEIDKNEEYLIKKVKNYSKYQQFFSHHQKFMILDNELGQIEGYLGGIDIAKGRYDNIKHDIFEMKDEADYYSNEGDGLIELWQDIHCFIQGPILEDLLFNFKQRWKFETKNDTNESYSFNYSGNDTCQLLRTISILNKNDGNNEKDIQDAYIHSIKAATEYIYIENQFFIGINLKLKKRKRRFLGKSNK
jgi:phosphatidylserine/phosphatidylglycerophosphate/cardiolipin synthase-like enzyme